MNIFFSSSSSTKIEEEYYEDADYISKKLAKGNTLITGCCMSLGMSGRIINNFKKNNSKISLETLKIYNENPKEFPYVTFNYYDNTFERTKNIYEKSDVLIILPGGTGTLAELFSFLEEARTQPNDKKIILYNLFISRNIIVRRKIINFIHFYHPPSLFFFTNIIFSSLKGVTQGS